MKNLIYNNQGIALIQALMVTAVVGVSAGMIMSQMRLTEKTFLTPRIRSDMQIAESAFRNLAFMNSTYLSPFGAASAGVVGGSVNPWLTSFETTLNLLCPKPGPDCRVEFQPTAPAVIGDKYQYDQALRRISTRIVYTNSTILIKPIDIVITVPDHILTGAPFTCAAAFLAAVPGATGPFFRGYLANGNPNCTGWGANVTATGMRCPPGEYVSAINRLTFAVTCTPFTTNLISCPANQYIGNLALAGGAMTNTCVARPNAFSYFPTVSPVYTSF